MGVAHDLRQGAIRVSLGWRSAEADVDGFIEVLGRGSRADEAAAGSDPPLDRINDELVTELAACTSSARRGGSNRENDMAAVQETVDRVKSIDVSEYKYGFVTDIESDKAPKGLSEDTVRFISAKKDEPEWLTEWRLEAYRRWLTMREPDWARVDYPKIDYQDLYYYSAPKNRARPEVARRGRSRTAAHLREARHSAARAGDPGRRRAARASRSTRCSTRSRSPPPSRRSSPRRA